MTKKLQKLSKEIAAKINKLDDLAGEVRRMALSLS